MKRAFIVFGFYAAAQAQPQPQDSQVIQALLSEVHQLRIALERSSVIGPRIQLAVERVKLQQDAVRHIADQLEGVKHELEGVQSDEARISEMIRNAETTMSQTTDPVERKQLGEMLKEGKPHLEQQQRTEQSLRSREAELSGRLQTEQASLDGLNDRLNQIERALSAVPAQ